MEIAIYGKGGIGKSTIAANISVSLAIKGNKVLQIGCDPKHDSTRLLLGGSNCKTALDYIKETGAAEYRIEDILNKGAYNIGCIEAGGPKPGVGCAGRGIITVFELLDDFNVKDNYDTVVYDVLGDVVCGGFAVPIRREYADTIFIVTSGEYMAIYAANNILRGVENYDGDEKRVAGIIYNKRNIKGEDERIKKFAEAVKLPVCITVPRSDEFARAEKSHQTVMDGNDYKIKDIFNKLADEINGDTEKYKAVPLSDEELERVVLGVEYNSPKENEVIKMDSFTLNRKGDNYLSKNVVKDEPLHGCAFNGATSQCVHIKDAVVVVHGPKSCSYLAYQSISSSGRRSLFERGTLLPVSLSPNIMGTDMDENEMVFGGMNKLRETLTEIKRTKPKAIIVVSTCPSGIIGDDIDQIRDLDGDIPIITLKADGNLTGDYLQGMLMAFINLAKQIIDKNIKPKKNVVNIIFEKVVAKNTQSNFEIIESYLRSLDLRVNCRFLCDTKYDNLRKFKQAEINLLAYDDYTSMILKDFFEKNYGSSFLQRPFPVGYDQTCEWLRELSKLYKKQQIVEQLINENLETYKECIIKTKKILKGKKLMVITYNHQIDWILKAALDVGMEISKLCILNFSQDEGFRTNLGNEFNVEDDYDRNKINLDLIKYKPDILLTNYEATVNMKNIKTFTIPMCPDVGFFSGINECEKWAEMEQSDLLGDWEKDEELFRQYYT